MSRPPRLRPIVALTLLETLRLRDRPEEFLMQEDPSVTLPRRLGLSNVISSQIGRYEQAVRSREQLREDEVAPLIALVLRREDAQEVLGMVGRRLASDAVGHLGWARVLPGGLKVRAGRRRMGKALSGLFPGVRATSDRGGVLLSAAEHFLLRAAPGGEACAVVAGFGTQGMERLVGGRWHAVHHLCAGTGDLACAWTVTPNNEA